ncbi:MAG: SoxR reducing system RseC family protein [Bacteroidota bacterium]
MSSKSNVIEHLGRVEAITANDIRVVIISQSACASCHAKGACTAADVAEKQVVVSRPYHSYTVGETVKVTMKQSLGYKALFLGYILPLIVLLVSLFVFNALGFSEGMSGLLSLGVLVPYYLILYAFRKRIEKEFHFDIEKL